MDENTQLPLYKMFIHPGDLKELRRDIWIDDPVPAQLRIDGIKVEIDVSYRGSHIRDFLKKSYQIGFFRPAKFRGAKQLHLNAEFKDPSMIRNKLSFDFFSEIGCLAPKSRHVLLIINGKTEGVYLEIESVDENFLTKRKLPNGAIFYAVDGDANFSLMSDLDKETKKSLELGYERKCGEESDDYHLQELIYQINTILPQDFENKIIEYVNVDHYFRWMSGIIFTQNYDGFVHNYALYRNGETGLFEVIPWDYDATWGRDVNGKVMEASYVPITGYNTLTARLLDVPNFRKKFRDLLEEILENQFTTDFMMPRAEALQKSIRPFILQDPYKRESIQSFDQELDVIREYIEERRKYLKSKLYKLD